MEKTRRNMRHIKIEESDYWRLVQAAQKAGLIPTSSNSRRDVAKLGAEAIVHEAMLYIESYAESVKEGE